MDQKYWVLFDKTSKTSEYFQDMMNSSVVLCVMSTERAMHFTSESKALAYKKKHKLPVKWEPKQFILANA